MLYGCKMFSDVISSAAERLDNPIHFNHLQRIEEALAEAPPNTDELTVLSDLIYSFIPSFKNLYSAPSR